MHAAWPMIQGKSKGNTIMMWAYGMNRMAKIVIPAPTASAYTARVPNCHVRIAARACSVLTVSTGTWGCPRG